ncbi:MAG: hypothetical protein ABFD49_04120 [Armatimonadota bacterium]|nr:hypothetical protein [bacterium]
MNNRIPIIILALLVVIAVIYRIANPPEPPTPGPRGRMPSWTSMSKVGDMATWQVNPSGTMWAGAWNVKGKDGKSQSAVWVIDFEKKTAKNYDISGNREVVSMSWADDNTLSALAVNGKSQLINVDTTKDKVGKPVEVDFSQAPVWPAGSKNFVAADGNVATVRSGSSEVIGKEVTLPVAKDAKYGSMGAISTDGGLFVISTEEDKVGGKQSYYLGNTTDGTSKRIFGSDELPGKVEGIWVSPTSVLVVCSERDKFDRAIFDIASGKLQELKADQKIKFADWPDAPKDVMFVSYNAGYKLTLADGKISTLFDFKDLTRSDDTWRREVQGGRLYPRKDGSYTCVSFAAGAIDIRTIEKDGAKGKELLPRM